MSPSSAGPIRSGDHVCRRCGCVAVRVEGDLAGDPPVVCARCGGGLGRWSAFKRGIEALERRAQAHPGADEPPRPTSPP